MRLAGPGVIPLADDLAARRDEDGADHRIRRGEPASELGELDRAPHEALGWVPSRHFSATSASTKACGSNGWRSSIFSPRPISFHRHLQLANDAHDDRPPLAVPSSLVRHTPVRPIAS
jgi:hypothetical protein